MIEKECKCDITEVVDVFFCKEGDIDNPKKWYRYNPNDVSEGLPIVIKRDMCENNKKWFERQNTQLKQP